MLELFVIAKLHAIMKMHVLHIVMMMKNKLVLFTQSKACLFTTKRARPPTGCGPSCRGELGSGDGGYAVRRTLDEEGPRTALARGDPDGGLSCESRALFRSAPRSGSPLRRSMFPCPLPIPY